MIRKYTCDIFGWSSIQACIDDIFGSTATCQDWIRIRPNWLGFFSFKQHAKKTEILRIEVESSYINYSMSVRNIGLILEKRVNSICKSCYYQRRNIGLIHKHINDEICQNLISLSLSLSLTKSVQRVQNCVARLVTRTHKREHITPVMFQLHWLPVSFRTLYKILFYTFQVLSGTVPLFLSDLIQRCIYQWEWSDLSPIHFWGYPGPRLWYAKSD